MSRWAPYRTCRLCGTAYWIPPPAPHYWGEGNEPSAEQHKFWGSKHDQWMGVVGTGPGRLLDVGCGFGHFVRWANDHGWDAWGFDTDPWAVERSVASDRVVSSVDQLGADFDRLTMWDVVEHQLEPINFVRSWRPRIRRGGKLLVGVPNFNSMKLRWPVLRRRPDKFDEIVSPYEHVSQFTPEGARLLLERSGFVDVRVILPPPSRKTNVLVMWALKTWPVLRHGLFVSGNAPAIGN